MAHHVHVLHSSLGNCSNNGISARFDHLVVLLEGEIHPERIPAGYGLAYLVKGNLPGCAKIVPLASDGFPARGSMFGGEFASSSDSRWRDAVDAICGSRQSGAVPIHDRFE